MRISRSNTPINQECSLFIVREEYPDHSLYYLNLDIRSRQNIAGVMTLLYEHLQENELFILMGFIYGLEKDFHRILPSLLSSVMILEHENKSGCQIQLICTDSNEVSVEEHGNARLSILNHYGSQLIFTSNILPRHMTHSDNYGHFFSQTEQSIMSLPGPGFTWMIFLTGMTRLTMSEQIHSESKVFMTISYRQVQE